MGPGCKKTISLILAAVLLFSLLPALPVHTHAAETTFDRSLSSPSPTEIVPLSTRIPVTPGQLTADGEIADNEIYGYIVNYELKKGHTLSISNTDYVFSVRKLSSGNYSTMLKQATVDSFTATEDMTVGCLIRKPDKSALTEEELAAITLYDTQYGMKDVPGYSHHFMVEAETIDGGKATTRANIFLPPNYSETGTPNRLIIMTNGYHGHLTDSVWNANTADDIALIKHYMQANYAVLVVDNTARQTSNTADAGCPQQVSGYFEGYEYVQQHFNVEELFSLHARSQGNLVALRIMREHPELVKCALMTGSQLSLKQVWDMVDTAFVAKRFGFDDSTGATYEADKVVGYDPLVDADSIEYSLPPTFWMMAESDASTITLSGIEKIKAHGNDVETKVYTATNHSGVCRLNIDECWNDALAYLEAHQEITSEHRFRAWETVKEATCDQTGEMRRYCADCDHYETLELETAGTHVKASGTDFCARCGAIWLNKLSVQIPVQANKLQIDGSVLEDPVYGHIRDYLLLKGRTLSISSTEHVFSVRQFLNGDYSTQLKVPATSDAYTATSDIIVGGWIRRPDSSELAEGELDSIYLIDSIYGMIGVEGYSHRFTIEAETIDGGTATTRANIFLPETYTETGTPTRLIIMTNGYSAYLTDSTWNGNTAENVGIIRNYLDAGYAVLVVNNTKNHTGKTPDLGCPQLVSSYFKAYEYVQEHLNVEEKFSLHSRSFGTFAAVRIMLERPELVKCAVMTGPRVSIQKEWPGLDKAFIANRFGFTDTTGATYEADIMVGHDPYTDVDGESYALPPTFWMLAEGDATERPLEYIEKLTGHGNSVTSKTYPGISHTGICTLNTDETFADALSFLESHNEVQWEQGTIAYANGLNRDDTTRLRTSGYLPMADYSAVSIYPGYELVRFIYDKEYQLLSGTNWLGSGVGISITDLQTQYPTAVYFRLALRATDNRTLTVDDLSSSGIALYAPGEEPENSMWEQGTIASVDGQNKSGSSRFRTSDYLLLANYGGVGIGQGYTMTNFVYDAEFNYLGTSSWLGSGIPFTTASLMEKYPTGVYFRVVFRADDQRTLTEAAVAASGVRFYLNGEEMPKPAYGFEYENVAQIGVWQDGAIWDGKLFVLNASGSGAVFDVNTGTKLSGFQLDKKNILSPHANSVCFGNTYYSSGDKYPLLYVNIYNNYASAEDRMEGTCCVYRVTEAEGSFATELVQVIRIGFTEDLTLWKSKESNGDVRPYGNFTVDTDRNRLYAFVMRDAVKTIRFFGFDIPALDAGTYVDSYGCNLVTLNVSDIREQFDTGHYNYLQGCCYHDGLIYSAQDFGGDAPLRVIDLKDQRVVKTVYLGHAGLRSEPEVLCADPDTGILYYAAADGTLRILNIPGVGYTHAIPESQGVQNAIDRAYALTDVLWTPLQDVPGIQKIDGVFTVVPFKAGITYQGIPYSGVTANDCYVGLNVSLESFLTALENENSVLYTENLFNTNPKSATYYGTVCSKFAQYVLDIPGSYNTNNVANIPGMDTIALPGKYTVEQIKLGDVILDVVNHTTVCTDILYDAEGEVAYIEISEAVMPLVRRQRWTPEEFYEHFANYRLCRYQYIDETPAVPSDSVETGHALMPRYGDKYNYRVSSSKGVVDVLESGYYKAVILRDGTVIDEIILNGATTFRFDRSVPGYIEMYLEREDGSRSSSVYACIVASSVTVTDSSDFTSGKLTVTFDGSCGTPLYVQVGSAHAIFCNVEGAQGTAELTFSFSKVSSKQVRVAYQNEYGIYLSPWSTFTTAPNTSTDPLLSQGQYWDGYNLTPSSTTPVVQANKVGYWTYTMVPVEENTTYYSEGATRMWFLDEKGNPISTYNAYKDGEVPFRFTTPEGTAYVSIAYSPTLLEKGTETLKKVALHTPGDINGDGDVNNKDLSRLFQYLSDYDVEVVEEALDVNGDGSVNNKDLTRLFQYLSDYEVDLH